MRSKSLIISLLIIPVIFLSLISCTSSKFKHVDNTNLYLNVSTNSNEKEWMYTLAIQLNGLTEQSIKMGRIDILTKNEAIEVDWMHKWHESIGQALHYSIETGKQPTIALISLTTNDLPKIDYVQKICDKLKIKMIILRPKNQTNI